MTEKLLLIFFLSWATVFTVVVKPVQTGGVVRGNSTYGASMRNSASRKRFEGDQVFRILPRNSEEVDSLKMLVTSNQYDFWKEPTRPDRLVVLHVPATLVDDFLGWAEHRGMSFNVTIADLGRLLDTNERTYSLSSDGSVVGTFPTYEDTMAWMDRLCSTHARVTKCGVVGKSFEKRAIKYIKIARNSRTYKKTIMIEGTMHAREWLSTATVVWMVNKLLTNPDDNVGRLLDKYNFLVVPIANPDGYVYTHTSDRFWRGTRSVNPESPECPGADPNRNWDHQWAVAGTSNSPCSQIYHGRSPFSEPETRALSEFIFARRNEIQAYFSFHAYSQYWLIPYGAGAKPRDYEELERVGKIGTDAVMAENSETWEVGNIQDVIYEASGGSIDWVKSVAGVKYSYCFELRPSHYSYSGFAVTPDQIEPSGRETWAGLVAAVDAME